MNTPLIYPPTLYALIIRLIAKRDGELRASPGELAHAAFLDIVHQVDPVLSQALHDKNTRKPFTISPLRGYRRSSKELLAVKAGQEGWLRITLLDVTLFQAFIRYFLHGPLQATVRLGDIPFQVTEILSSPDSHFLAGHGSVGELADYWQRVPLQSEQWRIAFTFASPTAFNIRNENTPFRTVQVLPDPALVFGELARYWDRMSGDNTMDAVRAYVSEAVVVARHNIRTRMVRYRRSKHIGFTGNVQFQILDRHDEEMTRHLNRLADLAFFTGLGSKTTMGMGQVYRRDEE